MRFEWKTHPILFHYLLIIGWREKIPYNCHSKTLMALCFCLTDGKDQFIRSIRTFNWSGAMCECYVRWDGESIILEKLKIERGILSLFWIRQALWEETGWVPVTKNGCPRSNMGQDMCEVIACQPLNFMVVLKKRIMLTKF